MPGFICLQTVLSRAAPKSSVPGLLYPLQPCCFALIFSTAAFSPCWILNTSHQEFLTSASRAYLGKPIHGAVSRGSASLSSLSCLIGQASIKIGFFLFGYQILFQGYIVFPLTNTSYLNSNIISFLSHPTCFPGTGISQGMSIFEGINRCWLQLLFGFLTHLGVK